MGLEYQGVDLVGLECWMGPAPAGLHPIRGVAGRTRLMYPMQPMSSPPPQELGKYQQLEV